MLLFNLLVPLLSGVSVFWFTNLNLGISSKYLRLLHRVLCSSLFMWDDFECAPRHLPPERVEVFPQRESQEHCRLGERTRERLRGRGKTLTALPERVKKSGSEAPIGVSDPQIERYFCFTAGRRYRSRCGWRWRYPQPCRRHRQWNTPGCWQFPAQQRQIRWSVRP